MTGFPMTGFLLNRIPARGATRRAVGMLCAAAVFSTGCATTINGRTQRVAVASDPPGARVFVGDHALGVTPTYVELDRGDGDLALRFEKDCYQDAVLPVPRRISNWVAGSVLFAGIPVNEYTLGPWLGAMGFWAAVGGFIDWRTGGAFTFPDLVRASLDPIPDAARTVQSGGGAELRRGCAPSVGAVAREQRKKPTAR